MKDSGFTPTERDLRVDYGTPESARLIAKIKADALREEADRIERTALSVTHVYVTEHVMFANGAPGLLRESADRVERGER